MPFSALKASLFVAASLGLGTVETGFAASGDFGAKRKACAPDLQSCPERGCEREGSADALANQIKRTRPDPGTPVSLTFDDFAELQEKAQDLVGMGAVIEADRRASLRNISLSSHDSFGTRSSRIARLRGEGYALHRVYQRERPKSRADERKEQAITDLKKASVAKTEGAGDLSIWSACRAELEGDQHSLEWTTA